MKLWDVTSVEEAIAVQNELKSKIRLECQKPIACKYAAGVDLAYWNRGDTEYAVCCIVVLDKETKQVVDHPYSVGKITVPYIPGCLAFRELPLVLETVGKLKITPDIYLFDGNGYLHPRHMGIATHASFYLNKPTIGVAKSYYKIGDTDYVMPDNEKGRFTDIVVDGEVYGRVLRTHKDVKPVFISVGNYIDLDTAAEIVCDFFGDEGHIPQPTRLADIETHRVRKLQEESKISERK